MAQLFKNPKTTRLFLDIVMLLAGCICTAFSVACILTPNGMTTSGLLGVSKIIEQLTGLSYSYLYYGMSVGILVLAFFILGKQ